LTSALQHQDDRWVVCGQARSRSGATRSQDPARQSSHRRPAAGRPPSTPPGPTPAQPRPRTRATGAPGRLRLRRAPCAQPQSRQPPPSMHHRACTTRSVCAASACARSGRELEGPPQAATPINRYACGAAGQPLRRHAGAARAPCAQPITRNVAAQQRQQAGLVGERHARAQCRERQAGRSHTRAQLHTPHACRVAAPSRGHAVLACAYALARSAPSGGLPHRPPASRPAAASRGPMVVG